MLHALSWFTLCAGASAWFPPSAPPPPAAPPGRTCSGEQVFTSVNGSLSVATFTSGEAPLRCSFVLRTTASEGLTLAVDAGFSLVPADGCDNNLGWVKVYDGTTTLAPMLAQFHCESHWRVASTAGEMLVVFFAAAQQSGTFSAVWHPSENRCGNGVCENSANEWDVCALADCQQALPTLASQHSDTK